MATRLNKNLLAEMHHYLNNELSAEERLAFEDKLSENEALREALQLDMELFEAINDSSNAAIDNTSLNKDAVKTLANQLRSEDYRQLSRHIKNAEEAYKKEQKLKTKKPFYKYVPAAVIILMVCISFYMFKGSTSLNDHYNNYTNWNELQSFIEKGDPETDFQKGELAFKNGNYAAAIAIFNEIPVTDELYPFSLLYLGASYDKTNATTKAINTFKKLTVFESSQQSKGYWYMAMQYLKIEDKTNAINVLKDVTANSSNFKFKEASLLLEKIDD